MADLAAGVFQALTPSFAEGMTEAERLGATHSEKLGPRSLDILHVASAVVLGTREFLAFDLRQGALARSAGLKTPKPPRP